MKIDSSILQRIFKYLTPSIGSPLKMAEFNSFLFDANEERLMVRIYNGTTESIVKMPGQFEPIRFAVDEFIYPVVNGLNGEVTFELDDTNLLINSGSKHYEFSTIGCETWQPIMTTLDGQPFDLEWVKLFNKVSHAIATDESRPIYCNYHVRDGQLFTSDGYRAIVTDINLEDTSFPQKEFDAILRCLDGNVYYDFTNNLYLRCELDDFTVEYCTGKVDGDVFDVKKIFKELESKEVVSTIVVDSLVDKLKDILIMAKQAKKVGDKKFTLHVCQENSKVYFRTTIQGLSNSEQEINCEVGANDFEFAVNPVYLMDYAKIAESDITIKFYDKLEAILLEDEFTKSLLMPMSIRE